MSTRTTQEVFDDHLYQRKSGDLEADIARNYATDVVVMSNFGIFHGHDGVRQSAHLLQQQLPQRNYTYDHYLTDQHIAFERWDGESERDYVKNGIDFFLIRGGYIELQLIYYKPIHKGSKET